MATEGPRSVRDVLQGIDRDRTLVYTTIMTVLDKLHRKGWVQRDRHCRAYHYRPSQALEEAATDAGRDLLDHL